jgi:hypothetical protein
MSNIKIRFEKICRLFAGQQAEILKSATQNPISFQNWLFSFAGGGKKLLGDGYY